jgi:hypothetical protein
MRSVIILLKFRLFEVASDKSQSVGALQSTVCFVSTSLEKSRCQVTTHALHCLHVVRKWLNARHYRSVNSVLLSDEPNRRCQCRRLSKNALSYYLTPTTLSVNTSLRVLRCTNFLPMSKVLYETWILNTLAVGT